MRKRAVPREGAGVWSVTLEEVLDLCTPEPNTGCLLWTGAIEGRGYASIDHTRGSRWVLEALGVRLGKRWALHTCDQRLCLRPAHLYAGDRSANTRDAVTRGRLVRGAEDPRARLTDDSVAAIRASTATTTELAARFGVARITIYRVRAGQRWRHVQ